MDLKQLEYLVSVAEAGSFSRAAVALDVTQPTLSRQIALLEAALGQRLLRRTGRGAVPTEAGEALLVHARAMLESARHAREELQAMQASPGGQVVVGLPPRVALGLVNGLVQRFVARFPRARIRVTEGLSQHLREWLIAGRLDMALLFDPAATPLLEFETLMRERMMLVVPPGHPRLPARIPLEALPAERMILPSASNAIRRVVDFYLVPRGIRLDVVAEMGAVQTVLPLVERGVASTILPESALTGSALARAPLGPPAILNRLVLATPRARPASALARATAGLLRELDFRAGL